MIMCAYPDVSRYPAAKKETTKNQPTCPCIPEHGIKEAVSFYQGIQKKIRVYPGSNRTRWQSEKIAEQAKLKRLVDCGPFYRVQLILLGDFYFCADEFFKKISGPDI
jgi:hypothetical protein